MILLEVRKACLGTASEKHEREKTMKKLLGISIVAMMAVSPMMANAALTKENLPANYVGTPSTDLATTTYVKGAYKATSARIDEVIDEINSLNSGEGSVSSQIQSGAQNATFTASNDSGISATDIKGAINELGADVEQNKSAISAINDAQTGILATAEAYTDTLANGAVATNTADIAAINNAQTGILKQAKDYTDALAAGAVATNTADIATINSSAAMTSGIDATKVAQIATNTGNIATNTGNIASNASAISAVNNKTITVVQEWGGSGTVMKISELPDYQGS